MSDIALYTVTLNAFASHGYRSRMPVLDPQTRSAEYVMTVFYRCDRADCPRPGTVAGGPARGSEVYSHRPGADQ